MLPRNRNTQAFQAIAGLALLVLLEGCSGDSGAASASGGTLGGGLGGSTIGSESGGALGKGGAVGGNSTSNLGSANGLGGAAAGGAGNGGLPLGGAKAVGGAAALGGGNPQGGATTSGGATNTTNGGNRPIGGSTTGGSTTTGGRATGGAAMGGAAMGGAAMGGAAIGGAANQGGTAAQGGAASTGGSSGANAACPGADPAEFALVQSWLNNTAATGALPNYAYSNIKANFPAGAAFNKLACSIAMSCVEFAPANWLRKCEAVIASAIVAESSYNPASVVTDSYATRSVSGTTANDPTVGLLQIRFSSTVHDYNYYGPPAKMAAVGCTWPAALTSQADTATFWATAGGTTYLAFMQDVACNIGLATWYYFYNATGNGGASAVWISSYCSGSGIAGNMLVGLLSHLQGGGYARPADANNTYAWGIECCACGNPSGCSCTGCTGRFAALMGIGTSAARPAPDPFLETLAPEVSKYCK